MCEEDSTRRSPQNHHSLLPDKMEKVGFSQLRKTFQVCAAEQPLALRAHRGDTKLGGKVVQTGEASLQALRFQGHEKECSLSLAGFTQLSRQAPGVPAPARC